MDEPARESSEQIPMDDMWQLAPDASVALMASTAPLSGSAALKTSRGSAESGGLSSAVIPNQPLRKTRSRMEAGLVTDRHRQRRILDRIIGFECLDQGHDDFPFSAAL